LSTDVIDIARRRLHNVGLSAPRFGTPEQVVQWLGAVQSQDYGPAKWSLGQRCAGVDDRAVEEAFAAGRILRTHVLRPTWHFVLPADIRWMLELTGPRVRATTAHYNRRAGLDDSITGKAIDLMADALRGGRHLTRSELSAVLRDGGILAERERLGHLLMHAELIGVLCSGAPKDRQQTYALLDDRAPAAAGTSRSRDEALAELTVRYFTSRGPATAKDFRWWSSLTLADIRHGLDLVGDRLQHEVIDGTGYWFAEDRPPIVPPSPSVQLLQPYDEYTVGFTESKYEMDISGLARAQPGDRPSYNNLIILDGQAAGHWKRTVARSEVTIQTYLYAPFDEAQQRALRAAADAHGRFLGLPATVL
jgi:hypothetical protein